MISGPHCNKLKKKKSWFWFWFSLVVEGRGLGLLVKICRGENQSDIRKYWIISMKGFHASILYRKTNWLIELVIENFH